MLLRQVHSAHSMPRVVSTVRVGTEQGVPSMPCIGEDDADDLVAQRTTRAKFEKGDKEGP